ncbi:hypothetical protein GYA93_16375 [Gordonia desulfuricans]|uniref:Uncharacterized protein n=1 Tax=Gordonia desulfuricans TaxID=89051 RepID=A0A7K3LU84_9ACTN|nr:MULTISPECIES: hypothetical protein [Gordonia]KOY49813.1 hypothetical protein ISGA_07745 [Gordonia sp. NB41Y]NDK91147.1 hypothetical protein [Gordonia desulfuricans]WLP88643.1 hypothetical protein Q9K23_13530 [Gordonia sp. NB41Y]
MRILVFPAEERMAVAEADDLKRFQVDVHGEVTEPGLNRALGGLGYADGVEHVWVSVDELVRSSGRAEDPEWYSAFGKMVEYAGSKGWTDGDGSHLRAHVVPVAGASA